MASHLEKADDSLSCEFIDHIKRTRSVRGTCIVAQIQIVVFGKQLTYAVQDGQSKMPIGPGLVDNTLDGILFDKRLLHFFIDINTQSGMNEGHRVLVGIEDKGIAILDSNLGQCRS